MEYCETLEPYYHRALRDLTLAMPITIVNIIGAIQWTFGGPKVVHAKPKRPIGKQGMTENYEYLVTNNGPTVPAIETLDLP